MVKEVENMIDNINDNIEYLQEEIEFLNSIDFTKPVDEVTWLRISKSPLKCSDSLAILVLNTFPDAKEIRVLHNSVKFKLKGFHIEIPTTGVGGINVDTSWYIKDYGEPVLKFDEVTESMKKYFEAIDKKLGWYECVKHRLVNAEHYKKYKLFFHWWFRLKWKNPHRDIWEKKFQNEKAQYEKKLKDYHDNRKIMKSNAKLLFYKVLPLLDNFSTYHGFYDGESYKRCTLDEIKNLENI